MTCEHGDGLHEIDVLRTEFPPIRFAASEIKSFEAPFRTTNRSEQRGAKRAELVVFSGNSLHTGFEHVRQTNGEIPCLRTEVDQAAVHFLAHGAVPLRLRA